jgi:hypothetical protein
MNVSSTSRLPVLSQSEAWQRLHGAPEEAQTLPVWARMLVGQLPLTTARLLELDALHRTGERLDHRLRTLTRWSAADANECAYGKAQATADFARSGARGDLVELTNYPERLSRTERAGVEFARKMMTAAYSVTDTEVTQLLDLLGEERLVALVLLLAHASYQDRIFLALDAQEEADVPPPITTQFARSRPAAPANAAPALSEPTGESVVVPKWQQQRAELEKQKSLRGRIRIPAKVEMLARIGEGNPLAWQAGLAWIRVCYTFQPELTDAWFACTGAFRQETDLNMVFQNSIFWVITEALQCFY